MTAAGRISEGPVVDASALAGLRALLERAGYTADRIHTLLSTEGPFTRDPLERPLYVRLLPRGEPLSTLIELFFLALDVPEDEARSAFGDLSVETLAGLNLVAVGGGRVEPLIEIAPVDGLLLASDVTPEDREPASADHVPGMTPPGRTLGSHTIRRPVATALDLGTGSGLQALLAARHAERVVGVDVNGRALRFAALNAALNGLENIELREGDWFRPVEGERFDLLVCNPPYLISPESEYVYRDSGLPGDSFAEGLVRAAPDHLEEGGIAHLLVEWGHRADEDWSAPLRRWIAGSGCDALVVHYVSRDPLYHAADWNERVRSDPAAYGEALDRWVDYAAEQGIERIAWGCVVLRRRSGENWLWTASPQASGIDSAGEQLARIAASEDVLSGLGSDEELLELPLAMAEDHRLEQTVVLADDGGVVERSVLTLAGGLRFQVGIDGISAHVLAQLDGERPLGDVLVEVAETAPEQLDPGRLAAGMLPGIRRLFELGFVVVPGSDTLQP